MRLGALPVMSSDLFRREEECENAETFGERHSDDGLNEHFARGSGIAANRFGGFEADKADAESGAKQTESAGHIAIDFSDREVHVDGVWLCCWIPPCALWARSRREILRESV